MAQLELPVLTTDFVFRDHFWKCSRNLRYIHPWDWVLNQEQQHKRQVPSFMLFLQPSTKDLVQGEIYLEINFKGIKDVALLKLPILIKCRVMLVGPLLSFPFMVSEIQPRTLYKQDIQTTTDLHP